jgi:hypothetical protein
VTQNREPLVVFYGEHPHDASAIKTLFQGLRPDIAPNRTRVLKAPPSLVKGVEVAKRRTRASRVLATLRALKAGEGLRAAIFHEDADEVEPGHEQLEISIKQTYADAPCDVVAAVSAWEIETWWFMFPDAVVTVCNSWRVPDKYVGRNVGLIRDAKEALARCVRPQSRRQGKVREYREEDCEQIARAIVELGLIRKPRAYSASWTSFVSQVDELSTRRHRPKNSSGGT